jgi:hypothetical protein
MGASGVFSVVELAQRYSGKCHCEPFHYFPVPRCDVPWEVFIFCVHANVRLAGRPSPINFFAVCNTGSGGNRIEIFPRRRSAILQYTLQKLPLMLTLSELTSDRHRLLRGLKHLAVSTCGNSCVQPAIGHHPSIRLAKYTNLRSVSTACRSVGCM